MGGHPGALGLVIGGAPTGHPVTRVWQKEPKGMKTFFGSLWRDEQGQDLIEYTLMLAFVALASAALFSTAGTSINQIWSKTNSQLSTAAGS
jgi:Flp pilus assembly pilin Flp